MTKTPKHPPGVIPHFVFYQHQVWVDKYGVEHEIETMDLLHVKKVIWMLHDISPSLYVKELKYRALRLQEMGLLHDTPESEAYREEFVNPEHEDADKIQELSEKHIENVGAFNEVEKRIIRDGYAWLENTMLMRALNRRAER